MIPKLGSFWGGLGVSAVGALALGLALAWIPQSPTWSLVELKRALDAKDYDAVQRRIDWPAVIGSAMEDLNGGLLAGGLTAILTGKRPRTIFEDRDRPIRISEAQVLRAWWGMRREGPVVHFDLDLVGQPVTLSMRYSGANRWKIVGLRPISALLLAPVGAASRPGDESNATTP